jgi:hypothetical protein
MDADVIVLCDIAELWSHPMKDDAIVIAKGGKSSARLCTCVWDCKKAKQYLPSLKTLQSDPDGHKKLMQLIKDQPHLVQNYNNSYNCIDGEGLKIEDIKILHYSDMGTQFSHKYSLPRLEKNNQKHWFDGKIMPHPRQDLVELFDQYYQEALDNALTPLASVGTNVAFNRWRACKAKALNPESFMGLYIMVGIPYWCTHAFIISHVPR